MPHMQKCGGANAAAIPALPLQAEPDAHDFRPERLLSDAGQKAGWLMPFGAGNRCGAACAPTTQYSMHCVSSGR